MTLTLAMLTALGVSVRLDGGDLVVRADEGVLTPALLDALRAAKPALVHELAVSTCSGCRHWWRHPDQATTGDCLRNHFDTNSTDDCKRHEPLLGSAYRPEVKQ